MRSQSKILLGVLLLVVPLVFATVPAGATPVCTGEDKSPCGGRTFPEPTESATALTFAETMAGLESLAEEFPEWVRISLLGEGMANPNPNDDGDAQPLNGLSFDGNPVLKVELTAPGGSIPVVDRKVVLISQSIHGNEPGGREGGVRYLEDLLRDQDPQRKALLDRVRLIQVFLNPDGWLAGDYDAVPDGDSVGAWVRGNGNQAGIPVGAGDFGNVDVNRNWPWRGPIPTNRVDPVTQPETQGLVAEVEKWVADGVDLQAATDIHGEVEEAVAYILLSSGQFDLQQMYQQRRHGEAIDAAVTEETEDEELVTVSEATGMTVEPGVLAASSEFLGPPGLSGSGFLGDWLAQREGGDTASTSTIELFNFGASPGANSLSFRREIFQIYVDTVRAIMGALIDESVVDHVPSVSGTGDVGYVFDPATTQDRVLNEPRSQMAFFEELDGFVVGGLDRIEADQVTADRLADLDGLVVATDILDGAAVAAVRDFAASGGNVVLTDAALTDLPGIVDGISADDVQTLSVDIAEYDFGDRTDSLLEGLRDLAFILTEPATVGYDSDGGPANTPAFQVVTDAWESAGGRTVGVTTDGTTGVEDEETGIGQVAVGDGTVTILGQLLPPPASPERILYGINDYGVLDTGYQILINALGGTLTTTQTDAFTQESLSADVSVEVQPPSDATVGEEFTVDSVVSNAGPDPSGVTTVSTTVPPELRITGTDPGCSVSGQTVTCRISGIASGQSQTRSLTATTEESGAVTVRSTVDSATDDPDAQNNTDSAAFVISESDGSDGGNGSDGGSGSGGGNGSGGGSTAGALDLTTTASDMSPELGDVVALTAAVTNRAENSADDVSVRLDLPPGVQPTGHLASCAVTDNVARCPVAQSLAPGATGEVTLDVVATRRGELDLGATATTVTDGIERDAEILTLTVTDPADPGSRLAGPERVTTAVAASVDSFIDDGAGAVVLARADAFPDALAGGPLAASVAAPLLLTPTAALPASVSDEIDRVLPEGGKVYVLGGTVAVSEEVVADVTRAGYDVVRLGGETRFETAVTIARETGQDAPKAVFVATGNDFPDALTAGAAAARTGGVVVLSADEELPDVTREYLDAVGSADLFAVGGQAVTAIPRAVDLAGTNRFETAVAVAERVFDDPTVVGVATGGDFPDALAGVAHVALRSGPILLAETDRLPDATAEYLGDNAGSIGRAYLYGGTSAISDAVAVAVRSAVDS